MEMTFSNLEQSILRRVMEKPQTVSSLLSLYTAKKGVSRAGFYKALSRLKRNEVVLVKDQAVTVNRIWLARGYQFFERYMGKARPSYFGDQVARLGEDESLAYSFRSLAELDIFLLNLMYDLISLGTGEDVLIEERHEFFFALEDERTKRIVEEIARIGGRLYLLAESDSALDRAIAKQLPKQVHHFVTGTERRDTQGKIVHTVGDITIELRLDRQFAKDIGTLYAREQDLNSAKSSLKRLLGKKQRHTVRIYKDPARARAMRSRFKKFFVL